MRSVDEIKNNKRLIIIKLGHDGGYARAYLPGQKKPVTIVFSWGGGWDHVSASYKNRTPTWEEMCMVKDIFFDEEECTIQYHPPKSHYINNHPHCLHLWKPQNEGILMPPKAMV